MAAWMYQGAGVALAMLVLASLRYFGRSRRTPLAAGLVVAALVYMVFAVIAGAGWRMLAIEAVGIAIYGALAWLGVRRSAGWLALGWALHPVWDVGLHLWGPAADVSPRWYAHLCLTFDLVIALYLLRYSRRGTVSS